MDRDIPLKYIHLLRCWYAKLFTIVKWKDSPSSSVQLSAGVRQGGVLSPLLFSNFVDEVLEKLNRSSLGCHINRTCFNAVMYADDLLLMSISLNELQQMIDLCIREFNAIDMTINISKSFCMRIGNRHNINVANIEFQGEKIEWKSELRYLGIFLVCAKTFKCNLQQARQKYFGALNGIFSKIGTKASPAISLSLINSFCLPVLLYGVESMKISSRNLNSLEFAYTAAFGKIFGSYDKSVVRHCQFYCGVLPITYNIDIRRLKFLNSLDTSRNLHINFLFMLNARTEINDMLSKYNLNSDQIFNCKAALWGHFMESI
jgi:hypothetical protein